jgi:hypothetical protein
MGTKKCMGFYEEDKNQRGNIEEQTQIETPNRTITTAPVKRINPIPIVRETPKRIPLTVRHSIKRKRAMAVPPE